jgi:glutathione S-transferase
VVFPTQEVALDRLRIYRIPFSTNVERIALACGHKGIKVEWVEVDPADRSEVVRVSGQELVPVVVAGETVLNDSPTILEWLEEQAPEPPLYPREPARRAEAEVFVQWFNQLWKRPPNLIADEEQRPEPDRARIAELGGRMRAAVPVFEQLLDGREYLLGEFGIADVTAFPFLKYAVFGLPEGDEERFHAILVEHQPLAGDSPLRAWAERVDARPRA